MWEVSLPSSLPYPEVLPKFLASEFPEGINVTWDKCNMCDLGVQRISTDGGNSLGIEESFGFRHTRVCGVQTHLIQILKGIQFISGLHIKSTCSVANAHL